MAIRNIMLVLIFAVLLALFFKPSITGNAIFGGESFEERRENVLGEIGLAIEDAKEEGRYKCCIEPACTMCYLGNWLWDDGSCYCDDMIAKGEFDKVCPQCKRGIEEGFCKFTEEACEVDLNSLR